MDIHKPKPWHGLRGFLKEYGIIVLGVLTALGLEQLAEQLHWRHKIEEAEHAMRAELVGDDGPQAYARFIAANCYDRQLYALEKAATARIDRRAFRKLALAYQPPARTWDSQAWQAAVASDVGPHMGAEQQTRWAFTYVLVPSLNNQANSEQRDVTELTSVSDRSGPLTETQADQAFALIRKLREVNVGTAWSSHTLLTSMRDAGVTLSPRVRAEVLAQARRHLGDCAREPAIFSSPADDQQQQFVTSNDVRALVGVEAGR